MIPILVAYGTTEGQTRKIAEFIGKALKEAGYRVQLLDTASPQAANVQPVYAAAILGGSVHQDKHLGALTHFVKANIGWLNAMPTAFFSVSLTAALADDESRHETERMLQGFLEDTGLKPARVRCIAGALKYTQYDFFKRLVMRTIAKKVGGSTDTAHDREYTDWDDAKQFALEFARDHTGATRPQAA